MYVQIFYIVVFYLFVSSVKLWVPWWLQDLTLWIYANDLPVQSPVYQRVSVHVCSKTEKVTTETELSP